MSAKKWIMGLLCLLMLTMACGGAGALEDADIIRQAEAMVAEKSERYTLMEGAPPVLRSVYQITFPQGFTGLSETAQRVMEENYGGYEMVICVEMGLQQAPPLLDSYYLAAGVKADGSFETCETPQRIVMKLYDNGILQGAEVRQLLE